MKINVTPMTLCMLLKYHFSLEACEAICSFYEDECEDYTAPSLGDLTIFFAEIDAEDFEEDDGECYIPLTNGNYLICR